jgi:hypothetical protein
MKRKFVLLLVCLAILISFAFLTVVSAEISVGVKEGDWIEYKIAFTGAVPEEHNVEWAKFEILDVEGKIIDVNITSGYSDGTEETLMSTLNLETGQIGDAFIIPANLNSGDTFPEQYEGTITISGVQEKTYVGAKRSVVDATTTHTKYYWDRSTGVLVEGISTYSDFALTTKVEKTNMWQPEIFGLDPIVLIILIVIAVIAVIAIFLLLKIKEW